MRSDIELLRIISAFGVVWFHSGITFGRDIAYAGLIVFVILSAYFACQPNKAYTVKQRALRLLLPCYLWCIPYALLNVVRGQSIMPESYSVLNFALATPSIHLWYLPFIFFVLLVLDAVKTSFKPQPTAIVAAITACALLMTAPLWREWQYTPPFGQYMHALAAVFIGVLFAFIKRINTGLAIALIAVVFASMLYVLKLNITGVATTYLVGFIACLLLLSSNSVLPDWPFIYRISALSFGIYLVHVLFIFLLLFIGISGLLLVFTSFVLSALSVYMARRFILGFLVRLFL